MQKSSSINIAKNHPSLPGHFPDNPIAPGAVILDQVFTQCQALFPELTLMGFAWVKFLTSLQPDCSAELLLHYDHTHHIHFTCQYEAQCIAKGDIEVKHG